MASKAFPTIVSTRRDGESPVTQALLTDYHARDESLISQPIDTRFPEKVVNANVFTEMTRITLFLPAAVATVDGAVTLVFVFEAKVAATVTGRIRVKLGSGGTYVETGDVVGTAYARFALTVSAANVAAAADAETDLIIEGRYTATAGNVSVRCEWAASRIERAP